MNQLFQTKPVKIQTLAEYLVLSREKLNFDIKTVSMLTQIRPSYIESLESGDWDGLPAEVYIKGFLKQLAELYRVKETDLIDQFEKEHKFSQKSQSPSHSPPSSSSNFKKININPKTLIIAVAAVLILGAGTYIVSQVRSVLVPPALEVTEPGSDINVSGTNIVVTGRTEVGADVSINNQTVLVDKNGFFAENLVLSPGLNVIEVKAVNKFGKESNTIRKVIAQIADTSPHTPAAVNIVVEIGPESTWIYLEADGDLVHRGTMLPGSTKTVTAKKDILLTSANAGSTKIIYNGKDLGKLGRDGEVIRNVEFSATEAK